MRKSLVQSFIWILVMAVLTTARVFISTASLGKDVKDCCETDQNAVVAEKMANNGYIYVIQDSKVSSLFDCSEIGRGVSAAEVYETEDNIYALILTSLSGENVYNVLEFDKNLDQVRRLGWVTFSQKGTITDLEIFDSSIYITQISEDGSVAYKYKASLTNLRDGKEEISLFRKIETSKWNACDTADYDGGAIIADAYLEDGEIMTVTYSGNEQTPKDARIAAGRNYLKDATFSRNAFLYRFRDQFRQMGVALIIGLLLIFLIPILLKRQNRMVFMALFWELILCVLLATYWLGYDTFCKFATPPILLVIGTLMGGLLFWFQGVDLHKLAQGMKTVVENNGEVQKEEAYGQDMNFLWNALMELGEKIKKINYSKYQMYEACYRFAPKGMVNFLGKDSIADVCDDEMVQVKTTIAMAMGRMFANDKSLESAKEVPERYMGLISAYQENRKGVLVSMSSDMYRSNFLFAPDYHLTQNFGNEYFNIIKSGKLRRGEGGHFILFHNCSLTYGILGNRQQGCQYVYSPELNDLTQKLHLLSDLGLEFVMTKPAYDAEEQKPTARYIGELELNCMKDTLPLYQVLDSMPNAKRSQYIENKDLFEKGIELMKQRDFYLARNAFAEELRVIPEDGMARWYLYLCEKYLDNADGNVSFVIK